jgi:hypothetical protein
MLLLVDIDIKQKTLIDNLSKVELLKHKILPNSLMKKLNRGFKEF